MRGSRRRVVLKFTDGGVQRHGESAFSADEIQPFEFHPEAMSFARYFQGIRGEGDHVVAPINTQCTFQGFIERRHRRHSTASRSTAAAPVIQFAMLVG